jgi:ketosteroid isomerase-like protein
MCGNTWHVRDGKILAFEVYLDTPVLLAALAKQP